MSDNFMACATCGHSHLVHRRYHAEGGGWICASLVGGPCDCGDYIPRGVT